MRIKCLRLSYGCLPHIQHHGYPSSTLTDKRLGKRIVAMSTQSSSWRLSLAGRCKGYGNNSQDTVARSCPKSVIWAAYYDFQSQTLVSVGEKKKKKSGSSFGCWKRSVTSARRSPSRYDRLGEERKEKTIKVNRRSSRSKERGTIPQTTTRC